MKKKNGVHVHISLTFKMADIILVNNCVYTLEMTRVEGHLRVCQGVFKWLKPVNHLCRTQSLPLLTEGHWGAQSSPPRRSCHRWSLMES